MTRPRPKSVYAMVWISFCFCFVSISPVAPLCSPVVSKPVVLRQARPVPHSLFHAEQAKESKKVW